MDHLHLIACLADGWDIFETNLSKIYSQSSVSKSVPLAIVHRSELESIFTRRSLVIHQQRYHIEQHELDRQP